MFGYIRVYSPELKVWENELYKGIYCGLCRHGGKRTTRLTRFFLSYDFVALATVRMALNNEKVELKKRFCPYCPKRKLMVEPNTSMLYTADAFVILAYYKLLDDKNDTKGIKKLIANIAPSFLCSQAKKAEERSSGLSIEIKNELERLSVKEKEKVTSLDAVADCFASLLGKTLSFGLEGSEKRISYEMGYHIGRYIYIIDALDDFKKDLKENNFNPLVLMYGNMESLNEHLSEIVDTLRGSMNMAYNAALLIENDYYSGIIENILTHGYENVISDTLEKLTR